MSLRYQLSRPFAFLCIKHKSLLWIQWWIPTIACVAITGLLTFSPEKIRLFGDRSYTNYTVSILTTLPGFFIAALAAVATFLRPELDKEIPQPTPTIKIFNNGQKTEVELTHRVFLCYMFAYLTAISLTTITICVFLDLLNSGYTKSIVELLNTGCIIAFRFFYIAIITWLNSSILVVTLFGLYFLAERIHKN